MIDSWYTTHLACPRDLGALSFEAGALVCAAGHRYPVIDGVPVMLIDDVAPTIEIAPASVAAATQPQAERDHWYLSTLSLSDEERRGIVDLARQPSGIDPVVAYLVAATNGLMYRHLIGSLAEYPIPDLPMPLGNGGLLLDVGCSWGRWTIAASRRGYTAVGIDPSLGAVMAARRVAAQLRCPARFVVADARYLPFPPARFDAAYSYSVLQHFSYDDAARAVREIGRVLVPSGVAKVQMPTRYGVRCLYHQGRRGFREARNFEVRYWTRPQLRRLFTAAIGPARIEVDGYFGIGLQPSDAHLMSPPAAMVLRASERLKRLSDIVTPLRRLADSVFVQAVRPAIPSPSR